MLLIAPPICETARVVCSARWRAGLAAECKLGPGSLAVMWEVSKLKRQTKNYIEASLHDTICAGKTTYMDGAPVDGTSQSCRYKCRAYVGVVFPFCLASLVRQLLEVEVDILKIPWHCLHFYFLF